MAKKNLKIIFFLIVVILLLGGSIWGYYQQKNKPAVCQELIVKRSDISQVVSVTGRVKANQKVNLSFEKNGKIAKVLVKIGDKVSRGQSLLELSNQNLKIKLSQSQSRVDSARFNLARLQSQLESQLAKLDKFKKGTRTEEIKIAEIKVKNAHQEIIQTNDNLEKTKSKTEKNLHLTYTQTLSYLPEAIDSAKEAIYYLTDIQLSHFNDYSQESLKIAQAKSAAIKILLGKENAGHWTKKSISRLNGGAAAEVKKAENEPTPNNIESALSQTIIALKMTKKALDAVPLIAFLSTTETANLAAQKSALDSKITTLINQQQSIQLQKQSNQLTISTAELKMTQAKNALALAEAELSLKKAGYLTEDISAQESEANAIRANIQWQKTQIEQAIDDVKYYQNELEKTILRSPIDGLITRQESKIGEMVLASSPIISIISPDKFKIEAYISESDIAKIKIGQLADLTLDAYGDQDIFKAKVTKIDPGETIIEGVASYKVTLQFIQENQRIKPGMTANIDILTGHRSSVLTVPRRAIIEEEGKGQFVKVIKNGTVKKTKITTGLTGSDGKIEIISGLKENEKICRP